jgi:gluconolactonase
MKKLRVGCIALLAVLVLGVTGMAKEKAAKEKPAKKGAAKSKSLVAAGAKVKKLAGDFKFTEGPAGDAEGDVYFSDIPNNRILKWSLDGKLSTFLENSGGANGLYFDKNGNLLACQGDARRLVSISPKGEITVLADKYNGKKFNSPNDLWIDPKGGVYFSDPRYGNREGMEQDGEHVYYIKPDRKTVIRVISDMVRPNGLIGTPNGKTLYVADNGAGKTYAYKVNKDGTLTDKTLFASEGSDGMTIDSKGNVYLTTNAVAVYDKKGTKIEEIQAAEHPANVTFAGKNNNTLFVTARTSLYAVDMQVKGAATPVRPEGQKAPKPKAAKESKKAKQGKADKSQKQ